jgi:hypothetical protein
MVKKRAAQVLRIVEANREIRVSNGRHRPVIEAITSVCRQRVEQLTA